MAFDPSTATLASGFDPTSAKPVGPNPVHGFDPGSAQIDPSSVPAAQHTNAQGQHPNWLQAGIMDFTNNPVVKDITSSFTGADLNGFGGLVARHLLADQGPVGDVTRAVGGVNFKPTAQQVNQATLQARQEAAQTQHDNAQNIKTPLGSFDPTSIVSGFVGGADPTLAIPIPGLGSVAGKIAERGLAGAAARVGVSAAAHGVYGSAADAAYQGADMLDGLQKDFDVQRNLHAAAAMATLGGAGATLHEASPFIQDLYKQRNGIDTTPSDNPTGTTNPLSGQQGLTPAQLQEYHSVLSTGNESDIHNYFNDKNVVPPSHTDIHDWVQRRDAQPNQYTPVPDERPSADQLTQNIIGTPDLRPAFQDHIDQITAGWKNKPDFEILNHPDDIADPAIRAQAKANDPTQDALGFVGPDGVVRIHADRIAQMADPEATLTGVTYHEALGHHGLASAFGDRLDSLLDTLADRNVGKFGEDVKQWQKENPQAYGGDRTRAAEEVLAEMSESGQMKPSIRDAVTSHINRFARKIGLNPSYSDAEVRTILGMAHSATVNGYAGNAVANGFRYMFAGPNAVGHDPNSPLAYYAKDGIMRNEIGDEHSAVTHVPNENETAKLSDVLYHPKLYEAYPQLRDLPVKSRDLGSNGDLGFYSPGKHEITLNSSMRPDRLHTTLLHEVQHAIQRIEDIPGIHDGTAHLAKADYVNSPLEKEARNTEARSDWGYEDRLTNSPRFARKSRFEVASSDYESQDLERHYAALADGYVKDTRGWDEIKSEGLKLGISPSDMKGLGDVGDVALKLWRLQAAGKMADSRISHLEDIAKGRDLTPTEQGEYLKALADFHNLGNRILDNRSELARGLQVSKAASMFGKANLEQVQKMMAEQGSGLADLADPIKFKKFFQAMQALRAQNNPAGRQVLMKNVSKAYWEDYLTSLHFSFMLGRLSTQAKAITDMSTGVLRNVFDKALAVPIGVARKGIVTAAGGKAKPGVSANEVIAHSWGLMNGAIDGEIWRATGKAAVTGDNSWVLPNGMVNPAHFGTMNTTQAKIGPVLGLPGNLVAAHDTFFRGINIAGELRGMGMAKALEEKAAGTLKNPSTGDLHARAEYWAMNPTVEMVEKAKDLTNRTLLLNNNPLNNALDQIKARGMAAGATPAQRFGKFIVQMIAPFVRVESNSLYSRVIQRSPLAVLDKYTRTQLAAGGAQADIAMARITYGTGMLMMAAAAGNKLTGNVSENPNKRKELLAGGETMNSVHEDGQYKSGNSLPLSLVPWDLHNSTAQMVKGAMDAYKEGDKENFGTGMKLAIMSTTRDLADMTWASSLAPYIESVTARDGMSQKIAGVVGDQAKTWVPGGLDQAERMTDHRRDAYPDKPGDISQSVVRSVQSAIPGMAQNLPLKYSVYGQPLDTGASFEGVHTPIPGLEGNRTPEPTDPGIKEMNRLANLTPAAIITPTTKTVKIHGFPEGVRLTTAQSEEYQMYAGQAITGAVNDQMTNGTWSQMTDPERIKFLRTTQTEAKKQVREALIMKEGWLNDDQLSGLRKQLNGK